MCSIYCNPDLKSKFNENTTFKQLMDFNKKNYQQRLQQSYYSDLSKVNKKFLQISSRFIDETNKNGSKIYSQRKHIIYIYSHFQPQNPTELHKYFLYFIHSFPEPNEAFHMIYVNSTQSGKGKCWTTFKNIILQELPLKYLLYMEKLILVRPSFLDKASSIMNFGVQNKFFSNKLQRFDSLKSFLESVGQKFDDLKKFFPAEVVQQQPDMQAVKPLIFSSFICSFNQNRTSFDSVFLEKQLKEQTKSQPPKKIDHTKLKPQKKGLENYPSGQLGIPLALQLLIFYFTEVPIRCQTEGLFRKCTSFSDEIQLIEQLEDQHYEVLTALQNQIAVASTMKRFLNNMEPPIIPYENYQRLTNNYSLESIIGQVHSFPILNFMTLMHVLKFLKDYIIPFSKKNLMTEENVAICFAPCLMKSKQITPKQFLLATINVEITQKMLKHFQEIFGDSQKQKRISSKTYKLYRKNSKIKQDSLQFKKLVASQNDSQDHKEIQIKIIGPKLSCPQDFLKPVSSILEDERQSCTEKLSERSSDQKNIRQVEAQSEPQKKKITGISLVGSKDTMSNIYLKSNTQKIDTGGLRKSRSYKRLPFQKETEQKLQRKSECDKDEILQEEQINAPSSDATQRLNKLRVNRSKMINR